MPLPQCHQPSVIAQQHDCGVSYAQTEHFCNPRAWGHHDRCLMTLLVIGLVVGASIGCLVAGMCIAGRDN